MKLSIFYNGDPSKARGIDEGMISPLWWMFWDGDSWLSVWDTEI